MVKNAHLVKAHVVPLGVRLGLQLVHLSFEGQVQPVADQHFRNAGGVLGIINRKSFNEKQSNKK